MVAHQAVYSGVYLAVNITTLLLPEFDGAVDQALVGGLVSSCENQRGVRCGILRLVDIDSCNKLVSQF